jgi:isoquinoline 1-oxidoreductase beta subunit
MDVTREKMAVAVVQRPPVYGAKLRGYDPNKAKKVPGVSNVLDIASGVAVVADRFPKAERGRKALEVNWDKGKLSQLNSDTISKRFQEGAGKQGAVVRQSGDVTTAMEKAAKVIEADYEVPYESHAVMEPMNCVADVRSDRCDVWLGTQNQTATVNKIKEITGLSDANIQVHTQFLGGGFGRRLETDVVADAVELSHKLKRPVKVIWTREDDMRFDYYRPAAFSRFKAGVDNDGMPVAWQHRIVSPGINARVNPGSVQDGLDPSSVQGVEEMAYAFPNLRVDYVMENPGVPIGFWRSVGHSQNVFFMESFFDEVAAAGGKDPVELRRALLKDAPRYLGVLELAADKARWGSSGGEDRHQGVAVAKSFGSWVAEVAEVSVSDKQQVKVHKVTCAVDCGMTVNPDTIRAQMESAVAFGLTAVLKSQITIKDGMAAQDNFDSFPLLRMSEMPEVEVYIVQSTEAPGGIGEPGVPPLAPAVANAVFAATGKPVRSLPIAMA